MRAPATRDQADAYRFGLRRLEAALVRGDPVPLHEQIRSQRRAALAGVLLGLLGLCGAAVFALVVPRPDWRAQAIVVGAGSGAMYVVAHGPDRLVPVANLAAARLVLAALRAGGAPGAATPVVVPDDAIDSAPRTASSALAGAPAVGPGGAAPPPRWAVCDDVGVDGRIGRTTVVAGAAPRPPNATTDGVLIAGPDGVDWLVTAGRRHRIDLRDGRLLAAYGLITAAPRDGSGALLALLPEGPELVVPAIAGRGGPAPATVPGRVGDVLVAQPVGGAPQYFVVLGRGVQVLPELIAQLLRGTSPARAVRPVPLEVVAAAPVVDELPVAGWPSAAPRIQGAGDASTVCWSWTVDGSAGGQVWIGDGPPLSAGTAPVPLARADGAGAQVDAVAVGPGGAVRAAGTGALSVVSAMGVRYGVADDATAAALGITAVEPAPEAALRLLPAGPPLDLAQATRLLDVPPAPG